MNTRDEEAVTNYSDEPLDANWPTRVIETYGGETAAGGKDGEPGRGGRGGGRRRERRTE